MTEHDDAVRRQARRPGGVTFVVILVWFAALSDIIGGIVLFLMSFSRTAFDTTEIDATFLRYFALIAIVVGLLTALVAMGLNRGSQFARVLTVTVMVLRLANAVWAGFAVGGFVVWGALFDAVLALIIIALLTNRSASDFFRGRIKEDP